MVGEVNHAADIDKTQVLHQILALVEHTGGIVLVVDQTRLESPCIVIVPATHEQPWYTVSHITLAQHGDGLARLVLLQRLDGTRPERRGNGVTADVVAAVAVDVHLVNPVLHRLNHRQLGGFLAVIELIHVAIAVGAGERRVIVVTVLGNPHIIFSGMVGDPVEPHLHAALMGCGDKCFQVGNGAEVAVHGMVVARGVGAAQRTDTALDATGMNRHEPDDVDAQVLQVVQALLCGCKCALARKVVQVKLIDDVLVRNKGTLSCPDNLGQFTHHIVAVIGEGAVHTATLIIPSENQSCGHRQCARIGPFIDFIACLGIAHIGHGSAGPLSTHIVTAVGVACPHPNFGSISHGTVSLKEHTYLAVTRQRRLINCRQRYQRHHHQDGKRK